MTCPNVGGSSRTPNGTSGSPEWRRNTNENVSSEKCCTGSGNGLWPSLHILLSGTDRIVPGDDGRSGGNREGSLRRSGLWGHCNPDQLILDRQQGAGDRFQRLLPVR